MRKNFNDLLVTTKDCLCDLDIIVITEANLKHSELCMYNIKGYDINSCTRAGRTGGGVLVYTHVDLCAQPYLCPIQFKTAEVVIVTVGQSANLTFIISIYRPPRINKQSKILHFISELNTLLQHLPKSSKVILCGDININLLDRSDSKTLKYENLLSDYGFTKCISDVTRREICNGVIVESCIDHIFVRAPTFEIKSAVILHKISDHYCTAVALESLNTHGDVPSGSTGAAGAAPPYRAGESGSARRSRRRRSARSTRPAPTAPSSGTQRPVLDNKKVRDALLETDFSQLIHIECPLKLYNETIKLFKSVYDKNSKIKIITSSNRDNKSWVTENMKVMLLERDKLFLIWLNDKKNMQKRLNYTKYRNKCQKTFFKKRCEFERQSIIDCKKDSRKVWEKINAMLGNVKKSPDDIILKHLKHLGTNSNISTSFADTFKDEIEQIRHNCDTKFLSRENYVKEAPISMRWQPVTSKDVYKIIRNMSVRKSAGSDLIRMCDLKCIIDKISPIIAKLTNLCVIHSKFPERLKEAILRPIFKKGDHKLTTNYRPIAILSSIEKVIEKCIVNQLGSFLSNNNILDPNQHGFQRGRSTGTLLTNFTDNINTHLNNKQFIVAIFFDFKKAFDTLEHEMLLRAMGECGVRGPMNEWFRDYLTSRSYRVRVADSLSEPRGVRCGVPQGSAAGPVCYLMLVNSLCRVLRHCSAYMFADDLCAFLAGRDMAEVQRLVQEDVDNVIKWSHDNGIIINADKTKMLVIHSPYALLSNNTCNIITHSYECFHRMQNHCTCGSIERVEQVTYLGMQIDENFGWIKHVDYVMNKLRILLSKFYQLSFKVPRSILKCLYLALVDSIIGYSLHCYGLTFKTHIEKIEKMQIKFLKLIIDKKTKAKCNHDYRILFETCNILPASLKHKYLLLVNSHGSEEHKIPIQHTCGTRGAVQGRYQIPYTNNYFGGRMLCKQIPKLYNELPVSIKNEKKLSLFKTLLKKHLLKTYYDT
ncbi:uncharacterized protein LOC105391608 [Plutella xylostella]|uniref:uncharacterized protein LOC105391608 n=1 Tax=Plutella xylostella TaxID=51655 RepID=UPI002032E651|nr:uncharacterized protein LOC105391608 [Plutella xylostella]